MKNNNVFYTLKLGLFIFKRSETIINFKSFFVTLTKVMRSLNQIKSSSWSIFFKILKCC